MRRALVIALLALTAAPAAQAATPTPVVKSVSPLRASIGEVMTITGRYFNPGEAQNTVVFINSAGKLAYVRADNATEDSMSLRLPSKLSRLLTVSGGTKVATKFRIKVISSKMGRIASGALAKPTIGPDVGGDCDKDGEPNPVDADDDNDFMFDDEEKKARTNPCVADSDGDKLLDGWEYLSALDFNSNALPYPGKRPYPNPLDGTDSKTDFDGDGMHAWAEHAMWWLGERKRPLSYSDGDQSTQPEAVTSSIWDILYPFGTLEDDERDFDGDGISNIYEYRMAEFEPWEGYPGTIRPNFLDRDTDGDGVADGADDQDHDDISNIVEFMQGTWVMNPCDPLNRLSRTCPRGFTPGEEPTRPELLCKSQTLVQGGTVLGFKEPEEEEGAEAPEADSEPGPGDIPCRTFLP